MKWYRALATVFLCSVSGSIFSQAYHIKIQIKGLSDTAVIVGHHYNDKLFPDDTVSLNNNGVGIMQGDEALPGGMYFILTPSGLVDFLLDTDQSFELSTTLENPAENVQVKGSQNNSAFYDYQNFIVKNKEAFQALAEEKKTASPEVKEKIDQKLKALNKQVAEQQMAYVEKYKHLFAGKFIHATAEIDVPEAPRDENGNITDSTFQYKYYRNHYFDNLDPADARFLLTPLYEQKIMRYINKVVPQIPDTLITEVDRLIEASRSSDDLFRYMLITLFNHYASSKIMGMDAVYIHIAEKYYIPEATWSDKEFITKLKKTVATQKPLLIGKKAPDFEFMDVPFQHFIDAENDTVLKKNPHVGHLMNLHSLPGDFFVLAFWESDCGHCKKSIPQLYDLYESTLKDMNITILSISTLGGVEGKEKWIDFINKNELYEWINCWNPYTYEHKVKYDINTTPQYFILDKDKNIIAKRIGPEDIADIIIFHKKHSSAE